MGVVRRLDHLILETQDIHAEHMRLIRAGYREAWPVGPFWPAALTSGIALGPFNLELVQPLDRAPTTPAIRTLVFEPTTLADAVAVVPGEVREKIEPDPDLLRLRGFADGLGPQHICTNLMPSDPPFPFFFCEYVPFLRQRLSPSSFEVPRELRVQRVVYGLADYNRSMKLIERMGGDPAIEWVPAAADGVVEVNPPL